MGDDLPEIRASDADRDRVAERLRDAMAEGRLSLEEFEERLEETYQARTYRELEPITRDLPAPQERRPAAGTTGPAAPDTEDWSGRVGVGGEPSSSAAVAIMSGFQRRGRWTVGSRFTSFAFWGGGEIDLREARFTERETVIRCVAVMGGMNVVVPPGVEVVVRGFGFMGGFDHGEDGSPPDPGAPRVIVTGFAMMGGVGVERKVTKAEKQRLKEERRRAKLEKSSPDELDDRRRGRKELGG
ncbi:hypothetical protein DSC45_07035 [Streptomyces sp. YIM 130001]|uniref:DUF1707 SHOCT-like domain-containing protein n=1 Tax=Streptomyces sp. YIM 130001 TaxID=2259644 RepID=UPI000E65AAB8|nr:DUF1707 domain-containing protein [Streptomyces sp. YIM 130001]RII19749.1 hypothetical protein DSC45_07035 [Streptomyces sp. YIM 130001]